jgi:hypothetical protein
MGHLVEEFDRAVRELSRWKKRSPTFRCSVPTSLRSCRASGAVPAVVSFTQRICSMRWKPVHGVPGATSPARASSFGSRSPKLSATGSIAS